MKLQYATLKGKFVSKNFINLSKRKLSKSEISLLSKVLKSIPVRNNLDKAKHKSEPETFGRMFQLKWFFWNDEKEFNLHKFKPKTTF